MFSYKGFSFTENPPFYGYINIIWICTLIVNLRLIFYYVKIFLIDGVYNTSVQKQKDMANRDFLSNYLEQVTNITGMTLVFPPIAMSFPFAGETNRRI